MALTVVPVHQAEFDQPDVSNLTIRPVVVLFDGSYPLGGYPLTPSTFGVTTKVVSVIFSNAAAGRKGAYDVGMDGVNGRLRVFTSVANVWTEVAAATNLSGLRFRALVNGY